MAINDLKEELKKIIAAEKDLKEYLDKKISDLPRETRIKLNEISTIPHTTASGLESVKPIWERLILAQAILEEEIDKMENKIISDQKKPAPIAASWQAGPQAKSNPAAPTPKPGPQPKASNLLTK